MDNLDNIYERLRDDMKDRKYAGPKMRGLAGGVLGSSGLMGILDFLNVFGPGGGLLSKGGRVGLSNGGDGTEDDRDEIAFNLFGKPYVELDINELDELKEEMIRLRHKSATGGRVGLQEGGNPSYQDILEQIQAGQQNMEQTQMTLPSPQMQALQGVLGPMMAQQLGTPIDTSAFAPQAAAQTGLQQQAAQLAATQAGLGTLQFDPTTGQLTSVGSGDGIAGYQPFLTQAATDLNAASAAAAAGQGAGAGALGQATTAMDAAQQAAFAGQGAGAQFMGPQAYQQFMSPYQQEVIDTTRQELERQLQAQQAQLGAGAGSAFGGGRFGVAQGELAAQGATGIAQTLAGLRQQGFQQAQQAAAQALAQQLGLGSAAQQQAAANLGLFGQGLQGQLAGTQAAQQQAAQNLALFGAAGQQQLGAGSGLMQQAGQNVGLAGQALAGQAGLAQLQPQLAAQNVGLLGQFGQQQQLQAQAIIDAEKQGAKMIAYEPYDRFGFFGGQLTGIMGGYPGGVSFSSQMQQTPNPFQQILGGLGTIAGIGLGAKQAGFFG